MNETNQDKEITKKIVRMFESGELSHTQENHNWNGYDIKVELKNFKEHGLDGYVLEINSNQKKIARVLYDSWSRIYFHDDSYQVCKTS
jgi:hypothetical protein